MQTELVHTFTGDGIRLDGILDKEASCGKAALLLHGTGDNFYGSTILEALVPVLLNAGFDALRANTRAHDGINTVQTKQGSYRLGAAYETVDDCRHDIAAWIEFLRRRGAAQILLCGHSMGAIKSLYTQAAQADPAVQSIIAVSPPRLSHRTILESVDADMFLPKIQQAQELCDAGRGSELMDIRYPFPIVISAASYLDKYGKEERYNIVNFSGSIEIPILFVYGSIELRSTMFAGLPDTLRAIRASLARNEVAVVEGANHNYRNRKPALSSIVAQWLHSLDADQGPPSAPVV